MHIPQKIRQDSIHMMNDREKQLYKKVDLEKIKTGMEILTARREYFRVQLDSIDNDFNEWLEEK